VQGPSAAFTGGKSILELIKADIDESHKTLCFFPPSSPFRQRCAGIIAGNIWGGIWIVSIMARSADGGGAIFTHPLYIPFAILHTEGMRVTSAPVARPAASPWPRGLRR
jgi:hypothetical protein